LDKSFEPINASQQPVGFSWPVRIYWEDTDAGGIVFYANYLKFFERSRTEWLRHLGIEQQSLKERTGGMFVVSQTNINYLRPTRLDEQLLVTASLAESGRASLIIKQQAFLICAGDDPHNRPLICEASIRIGWVDVASMSPKRIPPDVLASLAKTTS
jgi:acyl-CoA thioester hydrolase